MNISQTTPYTNPNIQALIEELDLHEWDLSKEVSDIIPEEIRIKSLLEYIENQEKSTPIERVKLLLSSNPPTCSPL